MVFAGIRDVVRKLRELGVKYWVALIVLILIVVGVIVVGDLPDDEGLLFISIIGFVGGVLALIYGFDMYKKKTLIANTPTSKVRSMAMGLVELFGQVRATDVIEAPFSGEGCVFYKYEVEEYKQSGKRKQWVTIDTGTDGEPFYLDDGTGQVLVDPEGAELEVPEDNRYYVDGGETPPYEIAEFIEQRKEVDSEDKSLDLGIAELDTGNDRRYTEYFVTPDEEVYVFGKALERPSFRGSSRNEENIVVNEDEQTPLFLISDSSEKELLSGLKWVSYGGLVGGSVIAVASFWVLLGKLGLL